MNFDILNMAIAEHYENVDNAINYLIDLYYEDFDIDNPLVLNQVLARYGLSDDGFESEKEYIIQEVKERIKQ